KEVYEDHSERYMKFKFDPENNFIKLINVELTEQQLKMPLVLVLCNRYSLVYTLDFKANNCIPKNLEYEVGITVSKKMKKFDSNNNNKNDNYRDLNIISNKHSIKINDSMYSSNLFSYHKSIFHFLGENYYQTTISISNYD
ncbi:MAG: hypothetical protein MHPSP_000214, partial [Paramarteilia canceri]